MMAAWDDVKPGCGWSILANRSCEQGHILAKYFSLNGEKTLARALGLVTSHFGYIRMLFVAAIKIISCNS